MLGKWSLATSLENGELQQNEDGFPDTTLNSICSSKITMRMLYVVTRPIEARVHLWQTAASSSVECACIFFGPDLRDCC